MIEFSVFASARNGGLQQLTKFYRTSDGRWLCALKVENRNGKVFEQLDDGFPTPEG
jgi:hypothetical protein